MLAGRQGLPGGVEVAVVGRGDADDIDAVRQHLATASGPAQLTNGPSAGAAWRSRSAAAAGAAGDGGQLHLDGAEIAAVKAVGVQLLEDGAVGVVEDHAQAGHADAEATRGGGAALIAAS